MGKMCICPYCGNEHQDHSSERKDAEKYREETVARQSETKGIMQKLWHEEDKQKQANRVEMLIAMGALPLDIDTINQIPREHRLPFLKRLFRRMI